MNTDEKKQAQNRLDELIESWDKNNIALALELIHTDLHLKKYITLKYESFVVLFGLKYLHQLVEIPLLFNSYLQHKTIAFNEQQLSLVETLPIERLLVTDNHDTKAISVLFRLKKLKELTFVKNPTLDKLPSNIEGLQQIERLYFIGTGLTELPASFVQLNTLQTLHLKQNKIHSLPDKFGQLQQLRELTISQPHTLQIPTSFGQLKNLNFLSIYIWGNGQVYFPTQNIALQQLSTLYIRCPKINDLPLFIQQLKGLKRLIVTRCQLKSIPAWVGQLSNLETLDLSNNPLETLPNSLMQLHKLQELKLVRTKLTRSPGIIILGNQKIKQFLKKINP